MVDAFLFIMIIISADLSKKPATGNKKKAALSDNPFYKKSKRVILF